jgi:AraC family transcriptional regulator
MPAPECPFRPRLRLTDEMSAVAVSAGTSRQASLDVGDFKVSEVTFPPNRRLPWHSHPLGCIAVVMEGVVEKRFARFEAGARAGALITMPPKEPHEDRFGGAGAAIVVVESQALIGQVSCGPDAEAALVALRIRRELAQPDSFTPLAVEGLALELTALAGRSRLLTHGEKWVERARSLLLERFRESVTPREIAAEIGVHQAHLARVFRTRYGESVGEFARRLRLQWAAQQLAAADVPLAVLAVEAGFCDQSHFTRAFRRQYGVTPARFRAMHR